MDLESKSDFFAALRRLVRDLLGKREPWEDKVLLDKIRTLPRVKKVDVDYFDRIIVTTDTIYIRTREKMRVAGQYQIRIDFKKSTEMVRMLNISQAWGDYDNPTISRTHPCMGTAKDEFYRLWLSRNLEKLIELCLYYISSAKDEAGYTSWESWFRYAYPMPSGFNFDAYDKSGRPRRPAGKSVPTAPSRRIVPPMPDPTWATREEIGRWIRAVREQAEGNY